MSARTRFAPSPTGELHLGNVRVAVLNWLFARHTGGRFLLRIEDTDVDRNVKGAEDEILSSLSRLGLDWDEGPDVGGSYGPYRQSERAEIYRQYAERLLDQGSAYRCYCSPDEIDAKRKAAIASGEPAIYDGTCRELSAEATQRKLAEGITPSYRFVSSEKPIVVEDTVRGQIRFDPSGFGDFVILKSDGTPTYNFAVVVDDMAMEVSHVIRGAGHLSNTPRQLMLYAALGADAPTFLHVPHVLAPDGSPLSKRSGARSLREYLDEGYHPDALINYLSLLSWSSATGDEVLPRERLIAEIDISRIGVSDVMLDPDKLEWMSGEYIRRMAPEELAEKLTGQLGSAEFPDDAGRRTLVAAAIQERINTLDQAHRLLPQFFPPDPMQWSEDALATMQTTQALKLFETLYTTLLRVEDWSGVNAVTGIRAVGMELDVKGRDLFMPVRSAITGSTAGPELPDVLVVQGKATTLRVLRQAITLVREALG